MRIAEQALAKHAIDTASGRKPVKSDDACAAFSSEERRFRTYLNIVEHEFPLEFLIAGELAQFETFAIPSISKLLHRTKQYEDDGVKRLDDTRATLYAVFVNPEGDSARETMLDHLNWVHSHYSISNDDNLYTLLRMFFNPIEWIQNRGWRHLTDEELAAMGVEMVKIGESMGIEFPSEDIKALYQWQANYRQEHQVYSQTNEAVAKGTVEGIVAHFPTWMSGIIRRLISCFLEDPDLIDALGLKQPTTLDRCVSGVLLQTWKWSSKVYRPWKNRRFSEGRLANYYPSYEGGQLDCCQLGPRKLVQNRNKTSGCPFH